MSAQTIHQLLGIQTLFLEKIILNYALVICFKLHIPPHFFLLNWSEKVLISILNYLSLFYWTATLFLISLFPYKYCNCQSFASQQKTFIFMSLFLRV